MGNKELCIDAEAFWACAGQDLLEPLKYVTALTRMVLSTERLRGAHALYLLPSLSVLTALKTVRLSQVRPQFGDESNAEVLQLWINLERVHLRHVLSKVPLWTAKLTSLRQLILLDETQRPETALTHASCMTALPLESVSFTLHFKAEHWTGWPSVCSVLQDIPSLRAVQLSYTYLGAARRAFSSLID